MCAAVCGSKRSYCFEDVPPSPVSKRHRCGSSASPTRLSHLSRLQALFPHLEPQVLERALEECGNDADSAIANLHEHSADSGENKSGLAEGSDVNVRQGALSDGGDVGDGMNAPAPNNIPASGAEWVDLFVRELMSATSMDDAKARTSMLLETLEKSIRKGSGEDLVQSLNEENAVLKQQVELVIQENGILKRAVAIQHERQKDYEHKSRELQHLKQLVAQYQEQLRTLEVNNYALTMHLKQAQQGNSIPGRFHPDVF